jgi:hypothetical protein
VHRLAPSTVCRKPSSRISSIPCVRSESYPIELFALGFHPRHLCRRWESPSCLPKSNQAVSQNSM